MKGTTTMNIGGEVRPLKFGTNQTAKFCISMNITLKDQPEVYERISKGDVTGIEIRNLIWSALDDGARFAKKPQDFDAEDVGDWLDDVDAGEVKRAFQSLIDSLPQAGKKKKAKGRT